MNLFELNAEARADLGKGASRRLRRAGKVPAVVYGGNKDPQSITLTHSELVRQLEEEAFYSHLLTLKINGQSERVVLKDMQRHPYKPFVTHVDLQRVAEDSMLHMHVPLHFINEDTCVGVKTGGGSISHQMTDVEIHCLAKDLPEFIEVDMQEVNVGESVHLSALKLPEGVSIPALAQGADHDLPVVTVQKGRGGAADEEEGEEGAAE